MDEVVLRAPKWVNENYLAKMVMQQFLKMALQDKIPLRHSLLLYKSKLVLVILRFCYLPIK